MTRTLKQPPPDQFDEEAWSDPPEGFAAVWEPDGRSRVATEEEASQRKCRRPGCERTPVMAFERGSGSSRQWWLYCDWHMYGRRVHEGVVEHRVLREVDAA